jgi:hypothetical protein
VSDPWNIYGNHMRGVDAFTLSAWKRLRLEGDVMLEFFGGVTSSNVHDTTLATQQAMLSRSAHYVASTVAPDIDWRLRTPPP